MSYTGNLNIGNDLQIHQLPPDRIMPPPSTQDVFCTKDSGYRGFWHGQTPTDDDYRYKYSGGLATYCAKHYPFAIYEPRVSKTFFCYGGAAETSLSNRVGREHSADTLFEPGLLYHMVGCFDHVSDKVSRPTILLDKWCGDAHDNPVISVGTDGHILIFSPSHGAWTTGSYIHRSRKPFDIDEFELVRADLFAYPQVHQADEGGFSMFHTLYTNRGRTACFRSLDSACEPGSLTVIAHMGQGHYQVSDADDSHLVSAFNYHPEVGGLEARTNLYFVESTDSGRSWTGPHGEKLELPLTEIENDALLRDYAHDRWLVYMKDIRICPDGTISIIFIRSRGNLPGPQNGPRIWTIATRSANGE